MATSTMNVTNDPPMMACGCVAQGTISYKGSNPVPGCLVHDCTEIAQTPTLDGRLAKCHCGNTRESTLRLAFFEFRGESSRESVERCKCGYYQIAHEPRWKATIKVIRRWFTHDKTEIEYNKEFHCPEAQKEGRAEQEADFFRQQHDKETEVFSAEVVSITQTTNLLKCKKFEPIGPQQYDKFYCGCNGWD